MRLIADPTGSAILTLNRSITAFDQTGEDGRHLVLNLLGGLSSGPPSVFGTALLAPGAPPQAPLAALVPLDIDLPVRLDALLQLWRSLTGRPLPSPRDGLTAQQRQRLILMLQAVDGRWARATRRQIAEALFGKGAVPAGGEFNGHHLRSRTARLIRDGLAMSAGGYLKLLKH